MFIALSNPICFLHCNLSVLSQDEELHYNSGAIFLGHNELKKLTYLTPINSACFAEKMFYALLRKYNKFFPTQSPLFLSPNHLLFTLHVPYYHFSVCYFSVYIYVYIQTERVRRTDIQRQVG
jgi:hypothetical protein